MSEADSLVIRRTKEVQTLASDPSKSIAVIGTFSLAPFRSNSSEAADGCGESQWRLKDVWITPEERGKGLASVSQDLEHRGARSGLIF